MSVVYRDMECNYLCDNYELSFTSRYKSIKFISFGEIKNKCETTHEMNILPIN